MSTLDLLLATVGALGVVIVAVSARLHRWPVSEPLIALGVGIVLGPAVAGVLDVPDIVADPSTLHRGAEILLAVSVMGVALRYPFSAIRRHWRRLALLLLVVMPAMALISTGLAIWALGIPIAVALLFGTAICPTDPVLSSAAVTGDAAERDLPEDDRQLLSLESGANDGLALPLVVIALAVATPLTAGQAALEIGWQILGALALGVLAGVAAAKALHFSERHDAAENGPILMFTLLLALLVLGCSGLLGVNGVFAAFVSGLAFNLTSAGNERRVEVEIDEAINQFAVLPFFLALGAMLPWAEWARLGWGAVLLTVAVLVLRRPPVLLALMRPLGLRVRDAAFLGWFGPVGVAAVFYLTEEASRAGPDSLLLGVGTLIVVASTLAHGVTAAPGRAVFRAAGRRDDRAADHSC
ncbi:MULTISPECIES: cation:proton antiporter [unclassified Dietzia]|uniref:cation:proton antiporter domain-containing protein n=1 Tax=unclassified Dietzia TaxID=2617939 RepID=UPI000D211858|nr:MULTISPECIES: cation:proton antiporter [unclassified Dietzia]AVZ38954.1 sodium:proton exchanger [Dietzia sp. JS16-p6b]QGW24102.1 sodium/hydrogen exchanger [Dietzia sp. DQ12-45-1b]